MSEGIDIKPAAFTLIALAMVGVVALIIAGLLLASRIWMDAL